MNNCDIEENVTINKSVYINKNESVFLGTSNNSVIKYCDISHEANIDKCSVVLNKLSNESLYRDDDTREDLSYHVSVI